MNDESRKSIPLNERLLAMQQVQQGWPSPSSPQISPDDTAAGSAQQTTRATAHANAVDP
jgi:hypothetical protein